MKGLNILSVCKTEAATIVSVTERFSVRISVGTLHELCVVCLLNEASLCEYLLP